MCPNYTKEEGSAIINVIISVICSDNSINKNENEYIDKIGSKFGLSNDDIKHAKTFTRFQIGEIFSAMDQDKKVLATKMVLLAGFADGKIASSESARESRLISSGILSSLSEEESNEKSLSDAVNAFLES